MDVSIIVVNYNTKKMLYDCIESIIRHTQDIQYEIIVVDNNSTDNSKEYICSRFKDVVWIANKQNYGFGKANNIGASKAQGDYLFLLNSDTILLNNAVKLFYDKYHKYKENCILGCYLSNKHYVTSYGEFANKKRMCIDVLYLYLPFLKRLRLALVPIKADFEDNKIEKKVDFIVGADIFIRKETYEELNGFDEDYFMYCEDEDLCYRARKLGINCYIIKEPQIKHLEGSSCNISKVKKKMLLDAYKLYYQKNIKNDSMKGI